MTAADTVQQFVPVTIEFNGLRYEWNWTLAHSCFDHGKLTELEFADACLITELHRSGN